MDNLTPEQRSAQMSRIRASNTKLEVSVRKGLHARGLRYRLGGQGLPGRPDIVLPKYNVLVYVHGCFWHGHSCPLFRVPKTRTDFWIDKIRKNQLRDQRVRAEAIAEGWRVFEVWECSLRGQSAEQRDLVLDRLSNQIRSTDSA